MCRYNNDFDYRFIVARYESYSTRFWSKSEHGWVRHHHVNDYEEAPHFSELRKLLHCLCWILLYIDLVIGSFTAQCVIKELKAWNDEKVWNKTTAIMLSSVILFFGGLTINIYALVKTKDLYVGVFLGFIFFVLLRWVFWCTWIHWGCSCNIF